MKSTNAMHRIVRSLRARSANIELQHAIDTASTPSLRDELLSIAQRQIS